MTTHTASTLTIGKVAALAEVDIETIRFYEREGLIADPPRTDSGYRQYTKDTVARLRFIKKAKALGFTLSEIRELLSLRASTGRSCAEVKDRAAEKITDIERRIASLKAMRKALQGLVEECSSNTPRSECPILKALDGS